jgi:oligoribonuclease NrnB/cAMP/cGMP phosphodiesterase (DHH superfamily)
MSDRKTLILYHANCPDGFSGAYAAWKKFGDSAMYMPTEQHNALSPEVDGADVVLIDFCYAAEPLAELQQRAASVVVLDHHLTNKPLVTANPNWRFSDDHSGCAIAWQYFHPETPMPLFLRYIEEADTWHYSLPDSKTIQRWIHLQTMSFPTWDGYINDFENAQTLAEITTKSRAYDEYYQSLLDRYEREAVEVEFEGHRILAVQAPRFLRSDLGHRLATKRAPFGIVWYFVDSGIRFSIRGDGSFDVSTIAEKCGSGGHHDAASFFVPCKLPLPFTPVHE